MVEPIRCACGARESCYLRANESQLPCEFISLAKGTTVQCPVCTCYPCSCAPACPSVCGSLPAYGGAIRSMAELMLRCARESGVVVSANACTPQEIAMARQEHRLYLDPSGAGFVLQSRAWLDGLRQCRNC